MISIIVASARNGVIGKENGLPWKLPAEMAYFKQKTTGHPIIMGRKTHESIGRALSGRTNIIISREPKIYKDCIVTSSLEQAIRVAGSSAGSEEIFIIGGESIYNLALSLADRIYLTRVETNAEGDKYFKFDSKDWKEVSQHPHLADDKNEHAFTFVVMEKK